MVAFLELTSSASEVVARAGGGVGGRGRGRGGASLGTPAPSLVRRHSGHNEDNEKRDNVTWNAALMTDAGIPLLGPG